MEASIENYLDSLRLGEAQVYRNIILFPLHLTANGSPVYVTLGEAIQAKTLAVTEVSQSGSVPELFVVNSGDQPVLLLDGEELLGAKQNRVLNTTILLREKSETKIPVSCTEHGRWAYSSAQFSSSDVIMEKKIRARKSQTVSQSLVSGLSFGSDQGQVWAGIAALDAKSGSHSPTGAMQDTFKNYANDLKPCLEAFPQVPGQQGILAPLSRAGLLPDPRLGMMAGQVHTWLNLQLEPPRPFVRISRIGCPAKGEARAVSLTIQDTRIGAVFVNLPHGFSKRLMPRAGQFVFPADENTLGEQLAHLDDHLRCRFEADGQRAGAACDFGRVAASALTSSTRVTL